MLKMDKLTDMDCKVLSILVFLIYVEREVELGIAVRKFNHQKDMSEYCRRRVAPSVFLGKQVMEASSHIMHFSQLEMPYSCTLSVRTESGNNIILVIQLLSKTDLLAACTHNADQLIIYEFGETFGGYWGNLPDAIIKKTTRNYTRFYTMKTTKPTTTKGYLQVHVIVGIKTTELKTDPSKNVLLQPESKPTDRPKDFIIMEVPLVNVSGNFQLGSPLQTDNAEEMFNFVYDVTPKNGVEYETSVLPLVQFSVKKQKQENYDIQQSFDLDNTADQFTFDSRLLFSTVNKRVTTRKRKWSSSRRLNFRKKNFRKLFTPPSSYFVKTRSVTNTVAATLNSSAWELEDLMKAFDMTTIRSTVEDNVRNILDRISNIDHNTSVYLAPNISIYGSDNLLDNVKNVKSDNETTGFDFTMKKLRPVAFSTDFRNSDNLLKNKQLHDFKSNLKSTLTTEFRVNKSLYPHLNTETDKSPKNNNDTTFEYFNMSSTVTVKNSTVKHNDTSKSITANPNFLQKGTMVDHESWENIVQAAPVMAGVLNKSETLNKKSRRGTEELRLVDKGNKKKRHIQSLEVENSRPRNLTTKRAKSMETESQNQFSNLQDLVGLVELEDDEITGRLALRYIRNYVGPALFNVCDFREAKSRQVFLFNASRIVLAINNFSFEGMTLVLTPAQSILGSMPGCKPGHLECQITGSRVCIDSMNACDAVPNCGSYDIYDEDRLQCGVTVGLQHNVYLTAFTFLAVIITMLYTVHYWLKQWMPKVSDAFFIYTDTTENTLFLETIMRSPNDPTDESYKFSYPGHFFDNVTLNEDGFKEVELKENSCKRIIKKCYDLILCKRKREEHPKDINEVYSTVPLNQSNIFSFAEYELQKFVQSTSKEEAVQTGESLEMQPKVYDKEKKDELRKNIELKSDNGEKNRDKYTEELKLIKFTKGNRSASQSNAISNEQINLGKMARRLAFVAEDEKELKSTVYERGSNSEQIRVQCEVHPEKPKNHFDTTKRLRFDKELTMIPSVESGEETSNALYRRRTGEEKSRDLDMITQAEPESNDNRDFKRFWGTSKVKKSKKKKEKHLTGR